MKRRATQKSFFSPENFGLILGVIEDAMPSGSEFVAADVEVRTSIFSSMQNQFQNNALLGDLNKAVIRDVYPRLLSASSGDGSGGGGGRAPELVEATQHTQQQHDTTSGQAPIRDLSALARPLPTDIHERPQQSVSLSSTGDERRTLERQFAELTEQRNASADLQTPAMPEFAQERETSNADILKRFTHLQEAREADVTDEVHGAAAAIAQCESMSYKSGAS